MALEEECLLTFQFSQPLSFSSSFRAFITPSFMSFFALAACSVCCFTCFRFVGFCAVSTCGCSCLAVFCTVSIFITIVALSDLTVWYESLSSIYVVIVRVSKGDEIVEAFCVFAVNNNRLVL